MTNTTPTILESKKKEFEWQVKPQCKDFNHNNVFKDELGYLCRDCGAYVDKDMITNFQPKDEKR